MENNDNNIENKIDWGPLKSGGSNVKTHNLVEISSQQIQYKATTGYKLFVLLFSIFGLGISSIILIEGVPIFVGLIGLVFFSIGINLSNSALTPIVFDKSVGYFWKGRKNPRSVVNMDDIKTVAKLDDVYGIQVIKEYVKSTDSKGNGHSYYSYEINLVLNSGERLNVVDYGNANSILQDASKLSKFLNKRVLMAPE